MIFDSVILNDFDKIEFFFKKNIPIQLEISEIKFKRHANIRIIDKANPILIRIKVNKKINVKWGDEINIFLNNNVLRIKVLNVNSNFIKGSLKKKYINFLRSILNADEETLISCLCEYKKIHGVSQNEIRSFLRINEKELEKLLTNLERKGVIKIISFSPFFILKNEGIDFIKEKIFEKVTKLTKKDFHDFKIARDVLRKKISPSINDIILDLALKKLEKEKRIFLSKDFVHSKISEIPLLEHEKKLIEKLEKYIQEGKISDLNNLEEKFNLPRKTIFKLIYFLIEEKKIFNIKKEYFLSLQWVEEILKKIKLEDKKILTIADFKKITGLSRKYLIPFLEFLDMAGITKRIGNKREILIK
ncbi:MAG: SelB C-terminal domain-containing protein [Acidobacteriota bacterium]